MTARYLRTKHIILVIAPIVSVIGCPVVPPASEWGAPDVGCLDQWSLAHFESGILLGDVLGEDSFWPTMTMLVGWEVVEPSAWPGEEPVNQICDLWVGGAGWLVAAALAD